MTNSEVRYKFMKYFIEKEYPNYDCQADDFLSDKNKVVLADESDEDFYGMICFKNAVLVKAKKEIYEWSIRFASKHIGFRCFDYIQLAALCQELLKHGYTMQGGQGCLPDMSQKQRVPPEIGFTIRVFNQNETMDIYNYIDKTEWHMCRPNENTSLTIAAFDKNQIIGLSSAGRETDQLWPIDIEVLPEYRNKGIAVALTAEITNILLNRGIIPYATGAYSNNASRITLFKCGYYPAWIGAGSCHDEWALQMLKN